MNMRAKSCNERVSVVDKSTKHSNTFLCMNLRTLLTCFFFFLCFVRCMLHRIPAGICTLHTHYVVLLCLCLCCWSTVLHSVRFAILVHAAVMSRSPTKRICNRCTICSTQWMDFENSIWCLYRLQWHVYFSCETWAWLCLHVANVKTQIHTHKTKRKEEENTWNEANRHWCMRYLCS